MTRRNWVVLFAAVLSIPALGFGQNYPMPVAEGQPPALYFGLPTWQFAPPITAHVGRYHDSTLVRAYQFPIRTYRAGNVEIVPERDRVYMKMGETFAAYKLSTFFSQDLGKPMQTLKVNNRTPAEQFLKFEASVYPEGSGSGWSTSTSDSQERLAPLFDWDDRGYVYLAYTFFGWGIVKDNGSSMPLVKQVFDDDIPAPSTIQVVQIGSKYYAIIGGATGLAVYDVTNPSNPTRHRSWPSKKVRWISRASVGGDASIALIDGAGVLEVYDAASLIAGGDPELTVKPGNRRQVMQVDSDGKNFYAVEGRPNDGGTLHVIRPSGNSTSSYSNSPMSLGRYAPSSVNFSADHLTLVGYDGGSFPKIFRVSGNSLEEVEIDKEFFIKYYGGTDGYAAPLFCGFPSAALFWRENGKEYLLWAGEGLGDVFEIAGSGFVSIKVKTTGGWGTVNPNSETAGEGPYYGDVIRFTTTSSDGAKAIEVDFDNDEADGASTDDATTGQELVYQYSGLTSETQIKKTRKARIEVASDSSVFATADVTMKVPIARIRVDRTDQVLTSTSKSISAPLVLGDELLDASDGSRQSHFSGWSLDGTETNAVPSDGFDVGTCGDHDLDFTTYYGPYSSSFTRTSSPDYESEITGVSYSVRPFVASIEPVLSAGILQGFKAVVGIGGGLTSSTPATFAWTLIGPSGSTQESDSIDGGLGSGASFTPDGTILQGSEVRLTVTLASGGVLPETCATMLESIAKPFLLTVPDPIIEKEGCATLGSECTFTAVSDSGNDAGWTYAWKINGAATGLTAKTITPDESDLDEGSNTVEVTVKNAAGLAEKVDLDFNVEAPLCSEPPEATFDFSGCGSSCDTSDTLTFSPFVFGGSFSECDEFHWDFDDGSAVKIVGLSEKSVTHKFASNGTYQVKLTVKNSEGSSTPFTKDVKIGGGTDPDPDPDPVGCRRPSFGVGFDYSATASGCGTLPGAPPCNTGEAVRFTAQNNPTTAAWQTCDRFDWDFGDDGESTARNPTYVFSSAGTYTVTFRVHNTAGDREAKLTVRVVGDDEPQPGGCQEPAGIAGLDFNGAASDCKAGQGNCIASEKITFTVSDWTYHIQDCDQFDWNFDDGTGTITTQVPTVDHTFNPLKPNYAVRVTIRNAEGTLNVDPVSVPFAGLGVKKPVSADFTFTGSATIGDPITFDATAVTDVDPVTSWSWKFSNTGNQTKSGPRVTHTFNAEGDAWAELTASNAGGAAPTIRKDLKIRAANTFQFVIPVAARGPGLNDSTWRTDIQVFNPGGSAEPMELTFDFMYQGQTVTKTLTVGKSTEVFDDFVFNVFGLNPAGGAVRITGTAPAVPGIWSRTYNVAPSGIGTFGQYIPAVRIDTRGNSELGAARYYLPGLQANDRFRTNVGWLNITNQAINLNFYAYDTEGTLVGEAARRAEPFQQKQEPITAGAAGLFPNLQAEVVTVRIDGGLTGDILSYGSIVDSVSNDPVFVSGVAHSLLLGEEHRAQYVPGVGHAGAWRSDLEIFNPDGDKVTFDLILYNHLGEKIAEAANVNLEAKHTLHLEGLIKGGTLLPVPEGGNITGMLKVVTTSTLTERFPIVIDRTYNDQGASGTFGQGIAAVNSAKANVVLGKAAIIPGVRADQYYYTNLGLASMSDQPTVVRVSLINSLTGEVLGQPKDRTLAPNQSVIDSGFGATGGGIVRTFDATADRGALKIEILSGGPVWAFGSVIDLVTFDPEYVPAVSLD